jgi:ubiquinol-cytochrome c reductase iron-sulfur subunit
VSEPTTETRTRVELTVASWSDDHLQPASRQPEHVARVIAGLLFAGLLAFAGFGAAYWQNWAPWTLGATLGAGMLLVGAGLTAWGKYLMPKGPFVEERHSLKSSPEDLEGFTNALVERGGTPVKRRPVLGGLLGAGLGVFGIVAMFPLLRSLGPVPGTTLDETNWTAGSYLVDASGRRIHSGDLAFGSTVTVFPQGFENDDQAQAQDQVFLIRAEELTATSTGPEQITGMTGTPLGYVAYSKLCTHLGCPVGLYERALLLLVCPCHQSMFNVVEKGIPVFGPAPRPLPQLPLAIDQAGYLYASAPFDQPVGPGFWERS